MSKVISVTAHPAIDNLIEVDTLQLGSVCRARSRREFPSGKGVNVGRVVAGLGRDVVLTGFIGRASLHHFEELESNKITVDFVEVDGETRSNLTVVDRAHVELHIQTSGPRILDSDLDRLTTKLLRLVAPNDVVVVAGSLPNGTQPHAYRTILEASRQTGARVVFDSSGASLAAGIEARPYMLKPNQQELEKLVGTELATDADVVEAARTLLHRGIRVVAVSQGAKGALLVRHGTDVVLSARIEAPESTRTLAIGSGDAFVAGFIVAMGRDGFEDWQAAMRLGVACGAANLQTSGPGMIRMEAVHRLSGAVIVEELCDAV
jgi:1-phosphofructokinase family hexose kinase